MRVGVEEHETHDLPRFTAVDTVNAHINLHYHGTLPAALADSPSSHSAAAGLATDSNAISRDRRPGLLPTTGAPHHDTQNSHSSPLATAD